MAKASLTNATKRVVRRQAAPAQFADEDAITSDGLQYDDQDVQDNPAEDRALQDLMVEYQKKIKHNSVAHSSTFNVQKQAIYDSDRKRRSDAASQGMRMIEESKQRTKEWRATELEDSEKEKKLNLELSYGKEIYGTYYACYAAVLNEVAPLRGRVVDAASHTVLTHDSERDKTLHKLKLGAESRLFQGLEEVKLATDATELIKTFRSLSGC